MRCQISELPMLLRATQAVVNLSAIRSNVGVVRRALPPGCRILVVVKGNAYGLGAVKISQMLQLNNIDYLGVAAVSEITELRSKGISLPILMFTEPFIEEYKQLVENDATATVFSFKTAYDLNVLAGALSRTVKLHLKVDTGMGRVGCPYEEAYETAVKIRQELKYAELEGVYTHFPVAEEPDTPGNREFTMEQIRKMKALKDSLKPDFPRLLFHCSNTGGLLNFPEAAFDMVRVGIAAYGCNPSEQGKKLELENVLTLKTRVIFTKRVPAGTPISYGMEYRTDHETTIATLPVGYADGYPRALSGRGQVMIRDRIYTIAGRVCMDMCMIDVGDDSVQVGDEAILIGDCAGHSFTVEDIARICGTIPYEVLVRISPRVSRLHNGQEGIDLVQE